MLATTRRTAPRRTTTGCSIGVLVAASLLAAGCASEDEAPETIPVSALPEDLCSVVPAGLAKDLALGSPTAQTTQDDDRALATCSMQGTYLGSDLTLELRLVSLGGDDGAALRTAMTHEIAGACEMLESRAEDDQVFEQGETDCELRDPRGSVVRTAQAIPVYGWGSVIIDYDGENAAAVAAYATFLSGSLTLSVPGEGIPDAGNDD
ncbi:hypothetical protein JK386_02305 [Nocardioides sp. zg-536]|uniref:DUF3558 domain-containing protein n=1 Tax=Nocardioides faecalis TaxID=2803858 RepID=A0A939BRK6_9ACTN|nr:hypothetical protein [Nocardioides faecalis]MBM9458724.1 hypothetical protein [Nocardioides faecalis]QVI58710.1 hypothetical protein KG111_17400 [Nocardioides faecalis]